MRGKLGHLAWSLWKAIKKNQILTHPLSDERDQKMQVMGGAKKKFRKFKLNQIRSFQVETTQVFGTH